MKKGNIMRHTNQSVIILLFSVSLLFSISQYGVVAGSTHENALLDQLQNNPYHFVIQRNFTHMPTLRPLSPFALWNAEQYLSNNESWVAETALVYDTIALFNVQNRSEDYQCDYIANDSYDPSADQIYATRLVPNQKALLVPTSFLPRIQSQLQVIEGTLRLGEHEIILTQALRDHIHQSIGLDLHVGDTTNISLARRDLAPEWREVSLGDYCKLDLGPMTITAIVNHTVGDSPWANGIYLAHEFISEDFLQEITVRSHNCAKDWVYVLVFPKLYGRFNVTTTEDNPESTLKTELLEFKNRTYVVNGIYLEWLIDLELSADSSSASETVGFNFDMALILGSSIIFFIIKKIHPSRGNCRRALCPKRRYPGGF